MTSEASKNSSAERVLILDRHPDIYIKDLQTRFPAVAFRSSDPEQDCRPALEGWRPDVVFTVKRGGDPDAMFRAAVACPSVTWLHVGGAGYDHIGTWDPNRLVVTNSAGVLAAFHAETVIGAMLMFNLNLHLYLAQQPQRIWKGHGFMPLSGKSLVIVGYGRIGGRVAEKAQALGMKVSAVSRRPGSDAVVDQVMPLDRLISAVAEADFISLHVPLNERTRHMIGENVFRATKPGAVLINTARGAVVDERALIRALENGLLSAAYLDVFEEEPLPAESPLWGFANVLITPHIADSISDWPERFASFFGDNLERRIAGQPLMNLVGSSHKSV